MDFEKDLKKLIKERYGSISAFAQAINTPYSTIDNIFKRGIMGVSIQIVLKICSSLNIDVEQIKDDKLVVKKVSSFTDEGYILYSQLDEFDKAEIRGEIKQMLKSEKYNTQNSVSDDIVAEISADVRKNALDIK